MAPVGHAFWQGAFSQCWHCTGRYVRESAGYSPTAPSTTSQSFVRILFQSIPMGTLFCILQAFAQVWHPTQRSRSIAMASLVMAPPYAFLSSTSVSENGMTGPHGSSDPRSIIVSFVTDCMLPRAR